MKKIAIIGSGISGLTCAYLLDEKYDVTVFEKNDYVGGHTATVEVTHNDQQLVIDTGFIVFNDRTYPNFNKLLFKLDVERQATEMSFSVHNRQSGFEYNGHNVNSLFAQRRNIFKPKFWKLIYEIIKFNRICNEVYWANQTDHQPPQYVVNKNQLFQGTLGGVLQQHHFSKYFREHYVLPMGAAIWSTSLQEVESFELKFFIQFFFNHGLLNIVDRPQWYVVSGGSRQYVERILSNLKKPILINSTIAQVNRRERGVVIEMQAGEQQYFDEVIFACHSDQALKLLGDATPDEERVLGGIPYICNEVILHTDINLLPKRELAWASWNYMLDGNASRPTCVTYNMNILQGLKSPTTFCVTLNQKNEIDPTKVIRTFVYEHPVLNTDSVAMQKRRGLICGENNTHFVGAYWYNGFHEDGVNSALDVAERFGVYP